MASLRLAGTAGRSMDLSRRVAAPIIGKLHIDAAQFSRHTGATQWSLSAKLLMLFFVRAATDLQWCPNRSEIS